MEHQGKLLKKDYIVIDSQGVLEQEEETKDDNMLHAKGWALSLCLLSIVAFRRKS